MTMQDLNERRRGWRDFNHTVRVIIARVVTEQELSPRALTGRYLVTLLAAAGTAGLNLPKSEVLAEGSQVGIRIETEGAALKITMQLRGFAALKAHAGCHGRLISADAMVEVPFQFDRTGTAVCFMTDTQVARAGLEKFAIEVFTSDA
jgi:hypothetical protein